MFLKTHYEKTTSNIKAKQNFQRKYEILNNNPEIAWKIVRRCVLVNTAILRCNLCLNEKLEIATHLGINLNSSK